eukprot:235879_1
MADDFADDEEKAFNQVEVKKAIDQSIEPVIGKNEYDTNKVNEWTSKIIDNVLKNLQNLNKPFKYVVTTVIMQNNGAGLHSASTCYWDPNADGSCSVKFENKTMHCITTVFCLAI